MFRRGVVSACAAVFFALAFALSAGAASAPTIELNSPPLTTEATSVHVSWIGTGEGPLTYDVSVRRDGGPDWIPVAVKSTETSLDYAVEAGHNYRFRARAHDSHGNLSNTGSKQGWAYGGLITVVSAGVGGPRDPDNPLGLLPAPVSGDPLAGATFFVDHRYGTASLWIRQHGHEKPDLVPFIQRLADLPEAHHFGRQDRDIQQKVRSYIGRVEKGQPDTVPLAATYVYPHQGCGNYDDGGPAGDKFMRRWYTNFAKGIGNHRLVTFLEIDATITRFCLSPAARKRRAATMTYALKTLAQLPHTVTYIDAGSADNSLTPSAVAKILKSYGVDYAQGFFLNATHYDWTANEMKFGLKVSKHLGGKHFVINTAVNGNGPLAVPKGQRRKLGNEVLCNPRGRAAGPAPTTDTGNPLVDGFFYIGNVGRSTDPCGHGDPHRGEFFPEWAAALVRRSEWCDCRGTGRIDY